MSDLILPLLSHPEEVPLLPLWAFPWVEVERWHILSKAQASREEGREDRDEDEAEGGGEEGMGTKGMGSILFSLSFTPTRSASASLDSSLVPSLSMSVAGEGRGKEGKELTEAYAHSPCSSSSSARALPLSAASTPTRPQQQHPQDQLSASLPVTDHLFTLHVRDTMKRGEGGGRAQKKEGKTVACLRHSCTTELSRDHVLRRLLFAASWLRATGEVCEGVVSSDPPCRACSQSVTETV